MMSLIFGLVASFLGLWGVWMWRHDFILFLKGFFPISLFLTGILAIIIGAASLRTKPNPMLHKKDHGKG